MYSYRYHSVAFAWYRAGLSVEELKAKAKAAEREDQKRKREAAQAARPPPPQRDAKKTNASPETLKLEKNVRKDSSPVKVLDITSENSSAYHFCPQSLSSILNLSKILSVTPAQVSALWTAYHASRSDGTGRGYLCASVPVEVYRKMARVASKYPTFVLPIPRLVPAENPGEEQKTAHEFYFMQWDFHGPPPTITAELDPFSVPATPAPENTPPISTTLFTPLQEYKLRGSFATPYLVLTHYTDLVHTHGLVLLRGEITPSSAAASASDGGRYLLAQEEAQILSIALQRFYLPNEADKGQQEREALLKTFHEQPEGFKWEGLLKHASLTA